MNHDPAHSPQRAQQPDQRDAPPFWRSRYSLGLFVFGAIAAYFLLTEHRAHFFGALPFLLLLACPLMHVFMHSGHSGHSGHSEHSEHSGHYEDGSGHGNHNDGKRGADTLAFKPGAQP